MASKDGHFISKEKHELDYVLRKWEKRTTEANRETLIAALDRFKADESQEPHTRELFYAFAAKSGLLGRLESKGEAEAVAEAAAAAAPVEAPARRGEGGGSGKAGRAFPWWIPLLALILLVVFFFLLRGFSPAQAKAEAPAAPGPAMMSAAPAQTEPGAMMAAPTLPAEDPYKLAELAALRGLPAPRIQVRFEPDSPNRLLPGEESKLSELVEALAAYTSGRILVAGHAAGIGYPAGEEAISRGRAEYVAERLRELGLPKGILLRTLGWGAKLPLADPDPETARRLCRRVEFSFE